MTYLEARENTTVNRLFNHDSVPGNIELPYQNDKDIRFLRITNITPLPLILDIYVEGKPPQSLKYYVCKDITINNGASLEFNEDDIFIAPGYKLMVKTPVANSFSAIYRLK